MQLQIQVCVLSMTPTLYTPNSILGATALWVTQRTKRGNNYGVHAETAACFQLYAGALILFTTVCVLCATHGGWVWVRGWVGVCGAGGGGVLTGWGWGGGGGGVGGGSTPLHRSCPLLTCQDTFSHLSSRRLTFFTTSKTAPGLADAAAGDAVVLGPPVFGAADPFGDPLWA